MYEQAKVGRVQFWGFVFFRSEPFSFFNFVSFDGQSVYGRWEISVGFQFSETYQNEFSWIVVLVVTPHVYVGKHPWFEPSRKRVQRGMERNWLPHLNIPLLSKVPTAKILLHSFDEYVAQLYFSTFWSKE